MKNFNKIDCRKISSDAAFEKKSIAIALSKEGKTYREIAKIVGLSISTISNAIKAYHKKGGIKNLKRKKRGRPTDSCKTLSKKQEKHLINLLTDHTPEQLRFKCFLWTRKSVIELIKREFGIEMPLRTVGEYLKRRGIYCSETCKTSYESKR